MKIDIIAGARPNFMKIAPIIHAIQEKQKSGVSITFRLIHTGQHFDQNMSGSFFEQLNIPEPNVNLGAGGGTQSEQTGAIMMGYENLLTSESTDICIVVGDVTSTMACSIVAKKMGVKVAHVEAGIRSYDLTMPEEINRMVTDSITDYFFTTSAIANTNLKKQGIDEQKIFFVGNTMIDTLLKQLPNLKKPTFFDELKLSNGNYFVMTLHRPANVDEEGKLKALIEEIVLNSNNLPIIFPVHPRTSKKLENLGIQFDNLKYVEPLGYLEFNYIVKNAKAVITDSGGITEETTVMGIPCLTLRDNTERPETITIGTNELVGTNPKNIAPYLQKLNQGNWKKGSIPEKWDGKTAVRIVEQLLLLE
ncbi:MAG TPA: UDP-N-acetylglucosamine 2-epimerase (non-hydrolyzing) [Flavobacterium sp.]|nr:UDP-N-acetylglucosamine 2-epimerase (non-hydrolyzing) [Flavobacterium sp.]HAT80662.1 UDP-N-acetylglucosamine 2-epimerase (non-hydrolyzing) [Flavobacterium sp.]